MNQALFEFSLRLGDNCLVLSHRLSELVGKYPLLEEELASANTALDLIGQATNVLEYAGQVEGKGRSADDLAYLRDARDYRCCLLVQPENGDFAFVMLRQFFFDAYMVPFYTALQESKDEQLAAIASKGIKEVVYHLRRSTEWMRRMALGTDESKRRLTDALEEIWRFTNDLFEELPSDAELVAAGIAPDQESIRSAWESTVFNLFEELSLTVPDTAQVMSGSRIGYHTEALGYLLAEMQVLPRTHPGATW